MLMNEVFGWFWITFGFLSGALIGMKFQNEDWLGGYSSQPRRMIRLGHISFLGLGILNILFAHTLIRINLDQNLLILSSWFFIVGAITMPVCCGLMAWQKKWQFLFAIPVMSLMTAVVLTFKGLLNL